MLKKSIEEFKSKFPEFEMERFIESYLAGDSREVLSNKFNIGEMPLRMFVKSLGLDWVKSKRHTSMLEFKYNLGLEDNILDVNLIKELERENINLSNQITKLYKSLTLVRDSNNALRKEHRYSARAENISDILLNDFRAKIEDIVVLSPNIYEIKTKPKASQRDGLVLLLGDTHFGSIETQEVSNNNFNYDIAERRLHYMVEKTLTNPFQSYNLVVFSLLDELKGLIHNSEYLSEEGFTTSMLKVVEVYTDIYSKLSPAYDRVDVYVTGSNHDRVTQKPTSTMKWDNLGSMCMKMVDMVLKAKGIKNVHFYFTKNEYHLTNINGSNILAFHGDTVRKYNPCSQTERANLQSICLGIYGKPYKFAISGHIHKSNMAMNEYGGYNISNGTLVGNGEYGVSNGFASIRPSQTILYFDEGGNIEQTSFIDLGHIQ